MEMCLTFSITSAAAAISTATSSFFAALPESEWTTYILPCPKEGIPRSRDFFGKQGKLRRKRIFSLCHAAGAVNSLLYSNYAAVDYNFIVGLTCAAQHNKRFKRTAISGQCI